MCPPPMPSEVGRDQDVRCSAAHSIEQCIRWLSLPSPQIDTPPSRSLDLYWFGLSAEGSGKDVLSDVVSTESIALERSLMVDYVVAVRSYQHCVVRGRRLSSGTN